MPINGRFITSLLVTVPGMEGSRAYGLREGSQEFVLDGAALSDRNTGGNVRRPPGLDTVQEFKVENNSSSAKFTRPTTMVFSTKSGANQLHGSLFETHRNKLRGGFRTSYFPIPLRCWSARMRRNAPLNARFRTSLTDAALSPDGISNYGMRSVPSIVAGANSRNAVSPPLRPPHKSSVSAVPRRSLRLPDPRRIFAAVPKLLCVSKGVGQRFPRVAVDAGWHGRVTRSCGAGPRPAAASQAAPQKLG